jgi:hypothetical protein
MQLAGQFERRAETRSGRVLCHLCVVWCSDYGVQARVLRDGGYVMHGAPDFTPCLHRISSWAQEKKDFETERLPNPKSPSAASTSPSGGAAPRPQQCVRT